MVPLYLLLTVLGRTTSTKPHEDRGQIFTSKCVRCPVGRAAKPLIPRCHCDQTASVSGACGTSYGSGFYIELHRLS